MIIFKNIYVLIYYQPNVSVSMAFTVHPEISWSRMEMLYAMFHLLCDTSLAVLFKYAIESWVTYAGSLHVKTGWPVDYSLIIPTALNECTDTTLELV